MPRRRLLLVLAVVATVVAAGIIVARGSRPRPSGSAPPATASPPRVTAPGETPAFPAPPPAPGTSACLDRSTVVTQRGRTASAYKVGALRSGVTYDLRQVVSTAYPFDTLYPLEFGKVRHGKGVNAPAANLCIVGGTVLGQQPRGLTWQEVKRSHDGDALRAQGQAWYVIDGLRADNVEDGVAPFGDGFVGRNLYFTYIRDDCIENDAISSGYVSDSLFDGCFMGLSERPSKGFSPAPPPPGEAFTLDGVLLRLEPMPYEKAADGRGHGQLFKWSRWANRLMLRNSVFLVEQVSVNCAKVSVNCAKAMGFPKGTVAENVTLVWTGPGEYPAPLPDGVKVTKDRAVWEAARAAWLRRHGYPLR
jgi:hypothetical protein